MARAMKENPYLQELIKRSLQPSDINEHLLTLFYYASLCSSVMEFGVRGGVSTVALFAGLYQRCMLDPTTPLVAYLGMDIQPDCRKVIDRLKLTDETGVIDAEFRCMDTKDNVAETIIGSPDLLFIDTLHDAGQCYLELVHNSDFIRKYIILHDTTTFAERGETPGKPGLNAAIKQWQMEKHDWAYVRVFPNNNGLTVFERIKEPNA